MRIYISGPMSGHDDLNEAAFRQAEQRLRDAGYDTVVPHDVVQYTEGWEWHDYMRRDLREMLTCDGVAALSLATASRGVLIECVLASTLSIPVREVDDWLTDEVAR